uniref:long-chain fatty acid transport protein 2-like isoform X2 n=1 Tax=Myxine glutinosa TaxID=7769 RepID=UPI00358E3E3B
MELSSRVVAFVAIAFVVLLSSMAGSLLLFVGSLIALVGACAYVVDSEFVDQLRCFWRFARLSGIYLACYLRRPQGNLLDVFAQRARDLPTKDFVRFEDSVLSYGGAERSSWRLARALRARGALSRGDVVAMLVGNEPLFVLLMLAMAKLGCPTAFLNYNLRAYSLLHCFRCSGARSLIVSAGQQEVLEEAMPELCATGVTVWVLGGPATLPGAKELGSYETESDEPLPPALRKGISLSSHLFFIYTSGTTGLPKAAIISHDRALRGAWVPYLCGATKDDVIYTALPLYHSAASIIALCGCITLGATLVLRKKFSASQFWNDCRKHNVTVIQYIGEICRYLCSQRKHADDREHTVRLAIGNGLRADVWQEFVQRFGNIRMCELYAATEGNVAFVNFQGKLGSIGKSSFLTKMFIPFELIQYDVERDEPLRDTMGHCIRAGPGKPGLLIAPVTRLAPFFGYIGNKSLSERKLLRGVFRSDDVYFNTGDLIVQESDGYLYFNDRIGDTFRWKGENVATTEVADILSMLSFVQEANIYGVHVPGHEGRIGMAALVLKPKEKFDPKALCTHVCHYLPTYARPWFLRLQDSMELTSTFKHKKVRLVEEAFDPNVVTDPLYLLDAKAGTYRPLDTATFELIRDGEVRL